MSKRTELNEIVDIISGYTFRAAIKDEDNGDTKVLQAKDLDNNSISNLDLLPKVERRKYRTEAFTIGGDVVIISRGEPRAALVETEDSILVSSSLYILRTKSDKILPGYLEIYLNSAEGQRELLRLSTGAAVSTLTIKELSTLNIYVPALATQQRIEKLNRSIRLQEEGLEKKQKALQRILDGVISKTINE